MAFRLERPLSSTSVGLITASRVIAARADLSFARRTLLIKHASGSFGEAMAQRMFLKTNFASETSGSWISLAPRSGRQGFDHLFLRIENGKFKWMVGESKFGTSQLGKTDGNTVTQMSWTWIRKRAEKIGDAYLAIKALDSSALSSRKIPFIKTGIRSLDVPLKDGSKVTFWKDSKGWHFDGPTDRIKEAQDMAAKMGADLKSATCNIRERLFRIETIPDTKDVKITIEDLASASGSRTIDGRTKVKELILKDILGKNIVDKDLRDELAKRFRHEFSGLSDSEIREMVDEFCDEYKNGALVRSAMPFVGEIALKSLTSGAIAGAFDVVSQLVAHKVDLARSGLVVASTAVGTGIGQSLSIVFVRTKGGAQTVRVISRAFGLRSSSFIRNAFAGNIGSLVTQAVMLYGAVLFGRSDLKTANRTMISGVAGTLGASGIGAGVLGTVMTFGTASTGTAISTLSGAAATKAAFAVLGGGTIASGGGGAALGGAVLGGIVVISAIVVTGVVNMAFHLYDKSQDEDYLRLRLQNYLKTGTWERVAANRLLLAV